MSEYFGKDIPKLGFGLMRLPRLEDGHTIDVETMKKMVDLFLASGFKYFDTAYVYDSGDSERAARAALVDRYPRESFYLVSKLNARAAKNEEEAKKELDVSLERTGAGYFDIYLLHAIDGSNIGKYDEYHLWDYLKEMKAAGKIHHYGFSFHGTPELLDELLTKHPDVDLVQLQLNYADWENPSVQSRRCYETVRKHGKGITVMEPVKGGTLAKPPKKVEALFRSVDPDASPASWAIRYIASKDGIVTVLSGMSNLEQMQDNTTFMKAFRPLSRKEEETMAEAQRTLDSIDHIACTGCHYCTGGCPKKIDIPGIFAAMNIELVYENHDHAVDEYKWTTSHGGKPADCVHCLQCERACPQHLPITSLLQKCAAALE
ncbi:MAG: aldo/keto reductase [Lachnospiraceae bacterium]|nr:aldo/keto reductase [Lachnospiraceae bacterium]